MIPPGQYLLEQSGVLTGDPFSPVTPNSASPRLATVGDRCIAAGLDTAVLLVALAIVDTWVFLRWGVVAGAELRLTAASIVIAGILNVAIFFAYYWLFEASFGATLGKALVGIGVINNSKRNILAASAIRNLLRVVDGVGFYLAGALVASCSRLRRRTGDICAGTVVVEKHFHGAIKIIALLLWLAALAGAGLSIPLICARTHAAQSPPYLNQTVVRIGHSDNSAYVRIAQFSIELHRDAGTAADHPAPTGDHAGPAADHAAPAPDQATGNGPKLGSD